MPNKTAVIAGDVARVLIRPAEEADIAVVAEIERTSFTDPWSASSFRSLLSSPSVHFAVAAEPEKTIGYVVMWLAGDEAEIANLGVDAGARRRGVGAALLTHAIATARASSVSVLFLEVRESNVAARELYASRGFAVVGRRKRYYRRPEEDALVLRLDVMT
jgi:ribosomal-protein-alanine N-acetyltransferase